MEHPNNEHLLGLLMVRKYPLKILMLIENCPVPTDTRTWFEAIVLRDHGYHVSVISPKGPTYDQESYVCVKGIHIYRYRLPVTTNKFMSYILEYTIGMLMTFLLSLKVWQRQGFDVIHATNPPDMFFLLGWFYRLFGKKFVFDQRDLSPEMFQVKFRGRLKILHRILLFLERCSYQSAEVVITTNNSQKRFAMERGHCSPDRVFIVGNGPDLNRLKLVQPEYHLKQGRRFLLAYIGEMGVQDGVEYALHALHELVYKRGRQDISLALLGDGNHAAGLRNLAHEIQLESYAHFTGWVSSEDVVRYLSVADIGLTPDPQNGFNEYCSMVKTMEYMALGKPVVAFDLAETRVSAQDAALYATPNLIEDFASKIEMLLDDEKLRLNMGAFGRKHIEDALSWEYDKEKLLLAYEMLFPQSF
jgi:glycosyltransferase involved in cell wall biosynthesis